MKEALLGFKFDTPKAICMIQIKWQNDCLPREGIIIFAYNSEKTKKNILIQNLFHELLKLTSSTYLPLVEVDVSVDKGYTYRNVMSVTNKTKESKTDVLFSPTSGTHFTIKMKVGCASCDCQVISFTLDISYCNDMPIWTVFVQGLLGDKTMVSISKITAFSESSYSRYKNCC